MGAMRDRRFKISCCYGNSWKLFATVARKTWTHFLYYPFGNHINNEIIHWSRPFLPYASASYGCIVFSIVQTNDGANNPWRFDFSLEFIHFSKGTQWSLEIISVEKWHLGRGIINVAKNLLSRVIFLAGNLMFSRMEFFFPILKVTYLHVKIIASQWLFQWITR